MLIAAPAPADPAASLRRRLAGFAGFLRANGFRAGGGDSTRLLEAAARVGVFDREPLRWSLKTLLCGRADEWRRFDALFDAYFLPPNRRAFAKSRTTAAVRPETSGTSGHGDRQLPIADAGRQAPDEHDGHAERHGASREESLASTDFSALDRGDDIRDIEASMRRFAGRLKHLQLRREVRFDGGRRFDLPGTIRRSIPSGGTPFRLAWKDHRRVRPRLALLIDVSRSMSAWSFFYLRLARALCRELADVHCFIFHTRITDVGEALRDRDPWRSQERLHLLAAGWAGGTRIGDCVRHFIDHDGSRIVHSRTGVIIVSDGYDTGEPEILGAAMQALRRRARRVVWLNPLLDNPGFEPVSGGMRAASPHLDLLAAGADLASIERVLPDLIEALR